MIKYIQIFGERGSGTNFLTSLIRKNYKGVKITSDFGGKHWFIRDHRPRGKPNKTTDNQCLRPLTDASDTLFIVVYRNPFDWLRSIHRKPFHGDGHWGLSFSDFIRKPWVSYTSKKLNQNWVDDAENYFLIEEAENIVQLRTQKINHFNALKDVVDNICFLNYETLNEDAEVMRGIASQYGIELQRPAIVNDPYHSRSGKKGRAGYVPRKYPEIDTKDIVFIRENLDWAVEQSMGYNLNDYDRTFNSTAHPIHMQSGILQTDIAQSELVNRDLSVNNLETAIIDTNNNPGELELTVHIKGLTPLELTCSEDQPIFRTLFTALLKNGRQNSSNDSDLIYLELGATTPRALYFLSKQIVSIESSPPVSAALLQELASE